jgi:hypothetical protein
MNMTDSESGLPSVLTPPRADSQLWECRYCDAFSGWLFFPTVNFGLGIIDGMKRNTLIPLSGTS